MVGKIDFDASVEAGNCCFCGKPLVNVSEMVKKQMLTVETTEGDAIVFHYHEPCFQEWLGKWEHVVPASSVPKPRFVRW